MHGHRLSVRPVLPFGASCGRTALGALAALGAFAALGALGACTSSDGYLIVTVESRPAVHDATSIAVSLSNGGTTRMDTLALRDRTFPVTFSISAPGRAGDLAIAVDASDAGGQVVGHGVATTKLDAGAAKVLLDSTDFVVNTDYAGDQFPSSDFEASGFQVAALADGTWTAAFRDSCPSGSCSLFARRFDALGRPVPTQAAAGTNAFVMTAKPTDGRSTPAIAAGATTTIAVWDAYDVGAATSGVACRTLDAAGRAGADQTVVAPDAADVVSVAALAGGDFVASWNAAGVADEEIRAAIIKPDCTAPGGRLTVSALAGFAHRSAVAGSGDKILFAWIVSGDLHVRTASAAGALLTGDTVLVTQTATDQIEHARVVAAAGGGFAIAVRWTRKNAATGPGRIELYRVDPAGAPVGTPALVTDRSASDFDSSESFAAASRPDGTVLVAWHTCGELGDGSMCGVFGRILRDTGEPVTDAFGIPTTTLGDQKRPSVAALPDAFVAVWSDASGTPPDIAGQSVRARVIYPPGPPGPPGP